MCRTHSYALHHYHQHQRTTITRTQQQFRGIGNNAIVVNGVALAGHVSIGEYAIIGKAFRNEIVARQFIFRMREFEQMEMPFFVIVL